MKLSGLKPSFALTILGLIGMSLPSVAQLINIPVPNGSFATDNSSSQSANQYPVPYSPYPDAEIFAGWISTSSNYVLKQVSTAGDTGVTSSEALQADYVGNTITESATPIITSLAANTTYTFTIGLNSPYGNADNVTLEMFSSTSETDPTNYGDVSKYGYAQNDNGQSTGMPYGPNPTPLIIADTLFNSTPVSASTLNGQGATVFTDYSVSFSTTDNPSFVGQNLTLAIVTDNGGVGGSPFTEFTDATLTETPEPKTWALMLGGFVFLAACVRRRLVGAALL